MKNKVVLNNINKRFKNETILIDVNMSLESGKVYGFYGRNGSGKSVLLKIMCGLIKPDSGSVKYNNKELCNDIYNYNVGALIENPSFFPGLTGFENLQVLADLKKLISDAQINEALDIVNLSNDKNKKYSQYSLGMKQKLGIAQAIMENQKIIYLDEPFNGIEFDTVYKIKRYLKSIMKDRIIVISSHIIEDLKDMCDEIYYFDRGTVKNEKQN